MWCEGEARLGLKPIVRRVWALKGRRPTPNGRHEFESVFVYGFAHPKSGRSRFLILPRANAECMGQALADFAGWADPGGRKVLVVILDGSGGHTARSLRVPPHVVLHRQPPCTPELQPAEHLWPLVREGLANRVFGLIFRYLPDARLGWREVGFGAGVTAVLFKAGQYAQALYFTYGTTASTYGAAGSFVVVLLWVYYSCWVLFYGAELIRERARMRGREVAPDAHAERVARPPGEPPVIRPGPP